MNANTNPTKVITGKCRLCYARIFEPASFKGSDEKHSACIVFPMSDTKTLRLFKDAEKAAIEDGVRRLWGGKKPPKLWSPLRNGDEERPDDPAFAGCYFFNAKSNVAPKVFDESGNEVFDKNEIYSGCYCRFSVKVYPFAKNGNVGVAVGLEGVKKVADGVPLAGSACSADDFDDDMDDIM